MHKTEGGYDEAAAEREAREAERAALELQKANERVAVGGFIAGAIAEIHPIGTKLKAELDEMSSEMKNFAQGTLTSDLDGGLKGKAAKAAKNALLDVPAPNFPNPVKA
jgi:hypothetical protein